MAPDPDSYAIKFRRALAQHLADKGLGTYRADGSSYLSTERGIYANGPSLPTATGSDNAIVLTWLPPVADGRADMLYRVQIQSRIKGTVIQAENLAAVIALALDHKQNIPPGFFVSWVALFSELPISPDSSGRPGTFQTFTFLGRRPLA